VKFVNLIGRIQTSEKIFEQILFAPPPHKNYFCLPTDMEELH